MCSSTLNLPRRRNRSFRDGWSHELSEIPGGCEIGPGLAQKMDLVTREAIAGDESELQAQTVDIAIHRL